MHDDRAAELARLQAENDALRARLASAEGMIDLIKRVGQQLPAVQDAASPLEREHYALLVRGWLADKGGLPFTLDDLRAGAALSPPPDEQAHGRFRGLLAKALKVGHRRAQEEIAAEAAKEARRADKRRAKG